MIRSGVHGSSRPGLSAIGVFSLPATSISTSDVARVWCSGGGEETGLLERDLV